MTLAQWFGMWEAMAAHTALTPAAQGVKPSLGYMKACLKAKEGVGRRKAGREGEREEGKRKGETGWIQNVCRARHQAGPCWVSGYLLQTRKPTLPDT